MRERLLPNMRDRLAGWAASYAINADHDAQLARALVHYRKTGEIPSIVDDRFDIYTKYASAQTDSDFSLLCVAYTLAEINGRMDILLSNRYQSWSNTPISLDTDYYDRLSPLPLPFWTSWTLPIVGNVVGLRAFAKKHNLPAENIDKKAFLDAIKMVQTVNILHNKQTAEDIADRSLSPKTQQLQLLASRQTDSELFLKSAKHTQNMANFWDRMYLIALNIAIRART